jgi:hypothetical protein
LPENQAAGHVIWQLALLICLKQMHEAAVADCERDFAAVLAQQSAASLPSLAALAADIEEQLSLEVCAWPYPLMRKADLFLLSVVSDSYRMQERAVFSLSGIVIAIAIQDSPGSG